MSLANYMRVRYTAADAEFPIEIVRVIRPQIINAMIAAKHHFSQRHTDDYKAKGGNQFAKNWCQEVRRIDKSSRYAQALRQVREQLSLGAGPVDAGNVYCTNGKGLNCKIATKELNRAST